MTINIEELRGYISAMYSDVARFPRGDFHFPTGRPIMETLGYDTALLDKISPKALESFAGVGHHFGLDPLTPGECVLDLGSGSGSDVFHAALQVGDTGKAVGIDMTDQMLQKSEKIAEAGSISNVQFVQGHIEELPFEADSFDCVISNGVINLAVEKRGIFDGVKRILKPSGRMMFSDIVTGVELPVSVRENCELWAECIGGAFEQGQYLELVESSGLKLESCRINTEYQFTQDTTLSAAKKFQVRSVSILAYNPA